MLQIYVTSFWVLISAVKIKNNVIVVMGWGGELQIYIGWEIIPL